MADAATQTAIWNSTIPLHITHASSPIPYLVAVPRLSYLPLLLPRLMAFFLGGAGGGGDSGDGDVAQRQQQVTITSFSYEDVTLRNLPVGLLCDLYRPELPWRLVLGDGPMYDTHDTFINSVKEADFLRNGTAKGFMSMSREHSTGLWNAVQDSEDDLASFTQINTILLNPPTPLKHIPLRVYIPSAPPPRPPPDEPDPSRAIDATGSFAIVQTLIPPRVADTRELQTVGSALHGLMPALFPSRRDPIVAEVLLHGASLPFTAVLSEVMRTAAYADGWINLCVSLLA